MEIADLPGVDLSISFSGFQAMGTTPSTHPPSAMGVTSRIILFYGWVFWDEDELHSAKMVTMTFC